MLQDVPFFPGATSTMPRTSTPPGQEPPEGLTSKFGSTPCKAAAHQLPCKQHCVAALRLPAIAASNGIRGRSSPPRTHRHTLQVC